MSLANERTYLAGIRASLGLLAGATAVQALDLSAPARMRRLMAAVLRGAGLARVEPG